MVLSLNRKTSAGAADNSSQGDNHWKDRGVLMSEEQLKAFLEKVKVDPGLQEKLRAAADIDALVAIA